MFSSERVFRISAAFLILASLMFSAVSVAAQSNKLPVGISGDNLVSSTRTGTMSVAQINQRLKTVFSTSAPAPTSNAIDLYKVSYPSQDDNARPVILSGLVVLPRGGAPKGLVIYNHGTTADPNVSPSRYTGGAKPAEVESVILAFASGGYAVAMPDYLGLGDHKGAHPYPLGNINSRSAIDLIEPARTLAERQNVNVGSRLFVTGYSEGGAVAMWTVRNLGQKSGAIYDVFAAAAMEGPYDLSGSTRDWLLDEPTDQEGFVIRLYLMSYMVYYFHKNRGVKLTDYFKPLMALAVSQAYGANRSDEDIVKRLAVTAVLMLSKNSIDNVITKRFKNALQTLDTSDPVISEMRKNDVYDWKPRTKMLLVTLKEDKIVDPSNTERVFLTMRRNGVGDAMLRKYVINDLSLNHLTAIPPALIQARRFFDKGFTGLTEAP